MKKWWLYPIGYLRSFMSLDINVRSYWIGLVLLFIGLTWSLLGCTVVGAVMVGESVLTSYMAAWVNVADARAKGAE